MQEMWREGRSVRKVKRDDSPQPVETVPLHGGYTGDRSVLVRTCELAKVTG